MSKVSMVLLDRHSVFNSVKDGLEYTFEAALAKDHKVTLFRYEDWPAWVTFSTVFFFLIIFDNIVLHRNPRALTVKWAVGYTIFWIFTACCFCVWVGYWKDEASAYMWMSGYILEWMLSFDNLFVFHLIFSVYQTPDELKHRPLYLGIMGAVVFRLAFIFIGEYLMHYFAFMHFVFGGFLVYTGIKTVTADEEDEDPSQQPLVVWLQNSIPFVSVYCKDASFFVRVPVNANGEPDIPDEAIVKMEPKETDPILEAGEKQCCYNVVDFSLITPNRHMQSRATMLFLVVLCLESSDILFAVDSVSAIVAQVPDLFLAYTSAVFAMLGLRATFFIIDVLVSLFSLLKYGVSIVLVFIGIKLIVGRFYHVPASIVCVVLVGAIAGSMVASVIKERLEEKYSGKMSPEIAERVAKIKHSPFTSPAVPVKKP